MFDAHAHLSVPPPRSLGVKNWLVPGVHPGQDRTSDELLRDPRLHHAAGLHPWHVPADTDGLYKLLGRLESIAAEDHIVAIGETGLDRARRDVPMTQQRRAFDAQIRLAEARRLPLIIHCVRAHGACLGQLRESRFTRRGMVHDFAGPIEMIGPWTKAGFMLSVSPRGLRNPEVLRAIPVESLLIETDDEGAEMLPILAQQLASIRGIGPEQLAADCSRNTRNLLALST